MSASPFTGSQQHLDATGHRPRTLKHPRLLCRLILLAGFLNAAPAFLTSLKDSLEYSGVDLRCKVVAARAMLAGLDPYAYEWKPGMSGRLLDPMRRHPGPSRATYPPTLLLMYAPLAELPYRTQRITWALLEWTALAASLGVLR